MHPGRGRSQRIELDPRINTTTIIAIEEAGAQLEISRTSDGDYWLHLTVRPEGQPTDGRIDYVPGTWADQRPHKIDTVANVEHIAIRVAECRA